MIRLEAVPNLSEGRRPEVLERWVRRVNREPEARVLDASRDPDHNRSVLTLAGTPHGLHNALLALYEDAVATLDLRHHGGVHPRIGALDVAPFVPLAGVSMDDAVAAAHRLGEAVAERFEIPVFLYEEAARRPDRRALPDIRRGGLEGLRQRIGTAGWEPDFGPPRLHPSAGATVIGARPFLIAINSRLDRDDLDLARSVAAAVRESSGGLPAVRALGLPLADRGASQVSMNLVDFRVTSLGDLLTAVRERVEAGGARVAETEIIGLLPEAAWRQARDELRPSAEHWAHRVLESRLAEP